MSPVLALGVRLVIATIASPATDCIASPYGVEALAPHVYLTPGLRTQWITARVPPYEVQDYLFYGSVGFVYDFSLCGSPGPSAVITVSFDTILEVFDPSGKLIGFNDDYCGLKSCIQFVGTSNGWYTVRVKGYGASSGWTWVSYSMFPL